MTSSRPARHVLLLSSDGEPSDDVERDLRAAGYDIRRCHDGSDRASFPCAGLAGDGCPLADGLVDVAVDLRQHPWPRPTPFETGVTCALRERVPLVVAGSTRFHPFDRWAKVTVDGTAGVVEACEEAIARSLDEHRAAAVGATTAVLAVHGIEGRDVEARATRVEGDVHLVLAVDVPVELRSVVATRAGAAVRAIDATARRVEVEIHAPAAAT
jgi:hypothetical protein